MPLFCGNGEQVIPIYACKCGYKCFTCIVLFFTKNVSILHTHKLDVHFMKSQHADRFSTVDPYMDLWGFEIQLLYAYNSSDNIEVVYELF